MITDKDSTNRIKPYNKLMEYAQIMDGLLNPIPKHKNHFKKNDQIKFKLKGKIKTGKITKIGDLGVDVVLNGKYYYCHDYSESEGVFLRANQTKNYK